MPPLATQPEAGSAASAKTTSWPPRSSRRHTHLRRRARGRGRGRGRVSARVRSGEEVCAAARAPASLHVAEPRGRASAALPSLPPRSRSLTSWWSRSPRRSTRERGRPRRP
jgi:hypothetical protein